MEVEPDGVKCVLTSSVIRVLTARIGEIYQGQAILSSTSRLLHLACVALCSVNSIAVFGAPSTSELNSNILQQVVPSVDSECTIVVPFGIAVPSKNKIYVDDAMGGVSELDLSTGSSLWQCKDYSSPFALNAGRLLVIKSIPGVLKPTQKLIGINVNDDHKIDFESQALPLPNDLTLPADDYQRKFSMMASFEIDSVTVLWKYGRSGDTNVSLQKMFPFVSDTAQRSGAFKVNFVTGAVQNVAFDKTLWQNLTAMQEKQIRPIPARLASSLEPDAVQVVSLGDTIVYVMRSYPSQSTLGSAGAVIKRQLKVRSEKSDNLPWEHELPAIFIPAMRTF